MIRNSNVVFIKQQNSVQMLETINTQNNVKILTNIAINRKTMEF